VGEREPVLLVGSWNIVSYRNGGPERVLVLIQSLGKALWWDISHTLVWLRKFFLFLFMNICWFLPLFLHFLKCYFIDLFSLATNIVNYISRSSCIKQACLLCVNTTWLGYVSCILGLCLWIFCLEIFGDLCSWVRHSHTIFLSVTLLVWFLYVTSYLFNLKQYTFITSQFSGVQDSLGGIAWFHSPNPSLGYSHLEAVQGMFWLLMDCRTEASVPRELLKEAGLIQIFAIYC
jgi:hypothetical protein